MTYFLCGIRVTPDMLTGMGVAVCLLFLAGFFMGFPFFTFAIAALWTWLTACIHGIRLSQHGRAGKNTSLSD